MSKYIVDIHGEIEGDYEIIGKYQEPKTVSIPKGVTNGDIIKAMFPKIEIYTDVINEIVDVEVCEDSSELRCSVAWWDAPYESEVAMAEYIDRNLIEWYGCDFENADCENRECSDCSHANCSHSQVMQISTANVIERSKIDKAIREIENHTTYDGIYLDRADVLEILYKLLESEG